jgi:hypothetical protein
VLTFISYETKQHFVAVRYVSAWGGAGFAVALMAMQPRVCALHGHYLTSPLWALICEVGITQISMCTNTEVWIGKWEGCVVSIVGFG